MYCLTMVDGIIVCDCNSGVGAYGMQWVHNGGTRAKFMYNSYILHTDVVRNGD